MRTTPRALSWIVLGTVAFGCGGGGTSGSGTAGTGGPGTGGVDGGSGVAGNGAAGTSGSAGTTGSGGSTAGTTGSAGGPGTAGTTGTAGAGGTTGGGGTGGATGGGNGGGGAGGRGGSAGTGTAGTTGGGGTAGGAGGRGGAAGTGTAGGGGTGGGSAGRGGTGGGTGGAAGATNCTGHAISLGSNGSASDPDTAQARIEIDLGSDLPTGNTQRTIEFWAFIKSSEWVGEKNEVYYYGGSGNAAAFGLDFGTNPVTGMNNNHATLNPFTGGSAGFTVDSTADLGITSSSDQWVHIAMVWNGTNVITYVNGAPKITASGTGGVTMLATGTSVITFGGNPTNSGYFSGMFDELRVWKAARTATEIQSNYNKPVATNSANLVGYWKFDEASGTTAADAVSTAGHTAHGGTLKADTAAHDPTFVTPSVPLPLVCP